jgi:hypothetical protein
MASAVSRIAQRNSTTFANLAQSGGANLLFALLFV